MQDTIKAAKQRKRRRTRARADVQYLEFVHQQPCLICSKHGAGAHHEPPKAMGGGGDWHDRKTIPLCLDHHLTSEFARHTLGKRRFEEHFGIDIVAEILRLNAAYDAGDGA